MSPTTNDADMHDESQYVQPSVSPTGCIGIVYAVLLSAALIVGILLVVWAGR